MATNPGSLAAGEAAPRLVPVRIRRLRSGESHLYRALRLQSLRMAPETFRHLVRMAIELAFAMPGVEVIELGVKAGNQAAIGLYESLGFEVAGVQRNHFKAGGRYWDRYALELHAS